MYALHGSCRDTERTRRGYRGHLKFCNAGHNPPIIGGGEKNGDFLKMIPNTPIGLWPRNAISVSFFFMNS